MDDLYGAIAEEFMNEDGTMARKKALLNFSQKHNIKIGTIADLINYRILNEKTVEKIDYSQLNDFQSLRKEKNYIENSEFENAKSILPQRKTDFAKRRSV